MRGLHKIGSGSAEKARRSRGAGRRRLGFQTLEIRRMLAGDISLSDGVLSVVGTGNDDAVELFADGDQVVVGLSEYGAQGELVHSDTSSFARSDLQKIVFQGKEGDDVLVNDTDVPAVALGGAGDDVMIAGTARDVLYGGSGDDMLLGSRDRLLGGSGQNVILEMDQAAPDVEIPEAPPKDDQLPSSDAAGQFSAEDGTSLSNAPVSIDTEVVVNVEVSVATTTDTGIDETLDPQPDLVVSVDVVSVDPQVTTQEIVESCDPADDAPGDQTSETINEEGEDSTDAVDPVVAASEDDDEPVADVAAIAAETAHLGVSMTSCFTVLAGDIGEWTEPMLSGTIVATFGPEPMVLHSMPVQSVESSVHSDCGPLEPLVEDEANEWPESIVEDVGVAETEVTSVDSVADSVPLALDTVPEANCVSGTDSVSVAANETTEADDAAVNESSALLAPDDATSNDDVLVGGEGRDLIFGGLGDDLLIGDRLDDAFMDALLAKRLGVDPLA